MSPWRRRLNDGDRLDLRTAQVLARLENVTADLERAADKMEQALKPPPRKRPAH